MSSNIVFDFTFALPHYTVFCYNRHTIMGHIVIIRNHLLQDNAVVHLINTLNLDDMITKYIDISTHLSKILFLNFSTCISFKDISKVLFEMLSSFWKKNIYNCKSSLIAEKMRRFNDMLMIGWQNIHNKILSYTIQLSFFQVIPEHILLHSLICMGHQFFVIVLVWPTPYKQ